MTRSLVRNLITIGALGLAVTLVGCKSDDAGEPTTMAAVSMSAVNDTCPIMGGDVDPNATTASFEGATVGFCCNRCVSKWDTKSDAEKREFIAAVNK